MRPKHVGDSYDIVKQALLRCLSSMGPWHAHPMFTAPFTDDLANSFESLLGVPLLSRAVLDGGTDRLSYLAPARNCRGHVFLDPDTGVRIETTRSKKAPSYLFGDELASVAGRSETVLTLVYDQCLARGREVPNLQAKLVWLSNRGLFGIAYQSHASFLVVGRSPRLVLDARARLVAEGHLPERRFVSGALGTESPT